MDVFTVGFLTLLGVTAVFYIVLFAFIYYWHLKKLTFVVVPAFFTFEFFLKGFFIVALISIIFYYMPEIIKVFSL